VNAKKFPNTIAMKDRVRGLTFPELNKRVNKLSHGLLSWGLKKGDRVAVLLENSIEIVEVYLATAKTGLVIVPINFRLVEKDVEYILNNSDAKVFIVHDQFTSLVDSIKPRLKNIQPEGYIVVGEKKSGYKEYEDFIHGFTDGEPDVVVEPKDTWVLLYTSGTTGTPKGAVRSHRSYVSFFLVNAVEFGFSQNDKGMVVMPLYHVNSTFYGLLFLYIGASLYVGKDKGFDPVELLRVIDQEKVTFVSLIPTHYHLILEVPETLRAKFDLNSMKSFLCSSAPARSKIKKGILKCFPQVKLFESYGSTEAGLVTLLRPEDQLDKLGSIGKECLGTDVIMLLDENREEVAVGEVGELYSRGPMMFDEYYKLSESTKASFLGDYFTARDMAKRDGDGYYYIVDRKDNMIITGGEHVYPSEVEEVISRHPNVFDVAVIGVPDGKWGEAVKAVVVLKDGSGTSEQEIIEWCRGKMAGYKKPKTIEFIEAPEMPRTATGKILHRKLREKHVSEA
jgi:acyl-CoA synthetase (AMP-forming)/AMP-acid ligase II